MSNLDMTLARMERVLAAGMEMPSGSWGRMLCTRIYTALASRLTIILQEQKL